MLTRILCLDVQDNDEARLRLIKNLPSYLRRSKLLSLIPNCVGLIPACAKTCSTHKPLNGYVIGSICELLRLEVGMRLDRLAANQMKLSVEQRNIIQSLRELHSMWMVEDIYWRMFLQWPSATWYYQEDQCEACILARVGRDGLILTNLRTVLLSRTRTRKPLPPPSLLRWVDGAINCHQGKSLEMFVRSSEDSLSLKSARKELNRVHSRRYQAVRNKASRLDHEQSTTSIWQRQQCQQTRGEESAADNNAKDFGNEIIDYYANDALAHLPVSELDIFGSALQAPCEFNENNDRKGRHKVDSVRRHREGDKQRALNDTSYHLPRRRSARAKYHADTESHSDQKPSRSCDTNLSRSKTTRSSKELAAEYHRILDEGFRARDSSSVYSRESWEVGSVASQRAASTAETAWSMLYS
jgi:hypothetical protein